LRNNAQIEDFKEAIDEYFGKYVEQSPAPKKGGKGGKSMI